MANGAMARKRGDNMVEINHPKPHILKVAEVGNFWRRKTKPQLRLEGIWLAKAGITANHHVCIENPYPGMLVIRLLNEPKA
jgi:hypothetical protein